MSTTESKTRPVWTRDFTLLFTANLVTWMGNNVYGPLLPMYLTSRMGATLTQVGLLNTAMTALDVVARLFFGYGMEVVGRKRLAVVALLLMAVISFNFSVPATLGALAVLRILQGIPTAAGSTTIHTMVTDVLPRERLGEGLSYYSLGTTLSIATGPLLALAILGDSRYALAFGFAGVCAVVGALLVQCSRVQSARRYLPPFSVSGLIESRTGWVAFATAIVYAAFAAQGSFITLYGIELGLAPTSWFLAVYGAGTVLSRAGTGRLFDKYGPAPSIASSISLLAAGLLLLGQCRSTVGYLGAALLNGLGFGIYAPAVYAMAVNLVPPDRRSASNAMVVSAMSLGSGIGAALCGRLADMAGYRAMYVAAAVIMLVPLALFFLKVIPDYVQKVSPSQVPAPSHR